MYAMTFEEIATALNLSLPQVKNAYKSGLAKISNRHPNKLHEMRKLAAGLHTPQVVETNEELD
jgi:DNA-directed RNA polymerase specialized sigma24 family protein